MADNELPKVTIITVCFNAEKFIERTLKSVLEQTYPNIEYLVIDGASRDGTVDIIKRYRDSITKWVSEKDRNHFDAMNKGYRMATGDFIWYVHAGDRIYAPETLSLAMSGYQGEDFIYGDARIISEDGEVRGWHKQAPAEARLSHRSFINGMILCHQSMIVRRQIAVEYDLEYRYSSDLDWSIRVLKQARAVRDTGLILCWYLDGGISARNRVRSVRERFAIQRKHFGLGATLWQQGILAFQLLKRGRLG